MQSGLRELIGHLRRLHFVGGVDFLTAASMVLGRGLTRRMDIRLLRFNIA